jgi:hypothetical protein
MKHLQQYLYTCHGIVPEGGLGVPYYCTIADMQNVKHRFARKHGGKTPLAKPWNRWKIKM